eukprot:6461287-Amphidinium_carterae.1
MVLLLTVSLEFAHPEPRAHTSSTANAPLSVCGSCRQAEDDGVGACTVGTQMAAESLVHWTQARLV